MKKRNWPQGHMHKQILLVLMGGWAEGQACADPEARTHIGASGNFYNIVGPGQSSTDKKVLPGIFIHSYQKNIRSSGLAVLCCQLRAGFSSKLGDYPKAFGLITLLMNIFCKDLYVPICPWKVGGTVVAEHASEFVSSLSCTRYSILWIRVNCHSPTQPQRKLGVTK